MKIAFVLYEGMSALDFVGAYDPLTRLGEMDLVSGLEWETVAFAPGMIHDSRGLEFSSRQSGSSLAGYDLVVIPGGPGSRALIKDQGFIKWLQTAKSAGTIAAAGNGTLLLAAAGLLDGKTAAAQPGARQELHTLGVRVVDSRLVTDGKIFTSAATMAAIELGLALCIQLAGNDAAEKIRQQMDYPLPLPVVFRPGQQPVPGRTAHVLRKTSETEIEISLELDGTGSHHIQTAIPFLDHMLTQVAVHGLFNLTIQTAGDLEIDAHHTTEDVALVLGQAFREALGNKAGIFRMASSEVPMDESLARVTVDFSGRPYAVVEAAWHNPMLGTLPASLIPHFIESFAFQAGCNLHARVFYGRDDHHQAEALFKALGRALDAATQLDPRREGFIPSSKGSL